MTRRILWDSPTRRIRDATALIFLYPNFAVLKNILLHDTPKVGAEFAIDILGAIIQKISAPLATPLLGGLQELGTIMSLVNATSANIAGDDTILG